MTNTGTVGGGLYHSKLYSQNITLSYL